jgi:hypothetical protein
MTWAWPAENALAPLLVIFAVTPVLVVVVLFVVAVLMTPAVVNLVSRRRYPDLERRHGASFLRGALWSLGSTLMAAIALIVSVPLWLIPPLILVLPPLIWGWLTYRVMTFDSLADHASSEERGLVFREHRSWLLLMGVATRLSRGGTEPRLGVRLVLRGGLPDPDPRGDLDLHAGVRVLLALVHPLLPVGAGPAQGPYSQRTARRGSGPAVAVLEPDDVVLAQVGSGLHLDHFQLDLAGIVQPVDFADGDVRSTGSRSG